MIKMNLLSAVAAGVIVFNGGISSVVVAKEPNAYEQMKSFSCAYATESHVLFMAWSDHEPNPVRIKAREANHSIQLVIKDVDEKRILKGEQIKVSTSPNFSIKVDELELSIRQLQVEEYSSEVFPGPPSLIRPPNQSEMKSIAQQIERKIKACLKKAYQFVEKENVLQ